MATDNPQYSPFVHSGLEKVINSIKDVNIITCDGISTHFNSYLFRVIFPRLILQESSITNKQWIVRVGFSKSIFDYYVNFALNANHTVQDMPDDDGEVFDKLSILFSADCNFQLLADIWTKETKRHIPSNSESWHAGMYTGVNKAIDIGLKFNLSFEITYMSPTYIKELPLNDYSLNKIVYITVNCNYYMGGLIWCAFNANNRTQTWIDTRIMLVTGIQKRLREKNILLSKEEKGIIMSYGTCPYVCRMLMDLDIVTPNQTISSN